VNINKLIAVGKVNIGKGRRYYLPEYLFFWDKLLLQEHFEDSTGKT
jgi:hypothetical protein